MEREQIKQKKNVSSNVTKYKKIQIGRKNNCIKE